jgi:ribosomal protein S18 acetylase RimI-like enzyme
MSAQEFCIECCAADERADALRLLHGGLSADQQTALPLALDAVHPQGEEAFAGLLVAKSSRGLVGVVWVQPAAGRTAVVWPPAMGGAASADLMRAAAAFLDQRQVALAQILVSADAPQDAETLAAGGFHRLVELAYLTLEREAFPTASPPRELTFVPAAGEHPERLGRLLVETYNGTLDCPQLNGLRDPSDVQAGYREQGEFSAERWFFVQHQDRDVGVLILSTHAAGTTWELVYMGVVPAARGHGFGGQIVHFAIAQAARSAAERIVLAVDEANKPGLDVYRAAGFNTWDRRSVYARLNGSASLPA